MNKTQITNFNKAYSHEATPGELSLIGDMMAVWGKLEPGVTKTPTAIRKGIVFGMGLAAALYRGEIILKPVKKNVPEQSQQG